MINLRKLVEATAIASILTLCALLSSPTGINQVNATLQPLFSQTLLMKIRM
ncbi:hypothetical protein H6G20_09695 [Desertifilum sp. FACHB-1129]|uniref:hypothetical protein n=1 Tax=Desertifilum TaxID=1185872 RepID=UPI001300F1AF|nr:MULTISPECIES: hypothetical protein [Desertifilum]MDA0211699.1 hypothetical protein [Cyanobacteria bacterium FC1]MDI9635368.1 hypothetical protein [Geitlerinema splendidum]MBD2311930.1 hypothetical protein [Desertifilum sp. FACHB-1129]MBD2322382.1 hypothetical protein [Desertifilum sp. FACHB-866]MBD2332545.1 hypothetical protein [Desertifilum sp. FACHB-868]